MKEIDHSDPARQELSVSTHQEQQLYTRHRQVIAQEYESAWLTAADVEKNWKLRITRQGAVLIPGKFNWKHQSMALGIVWDLPEGVKPAWSNQVDGLGDYVGPVLTAGDPALLEDIMKNPPNRISVRQLMKRNRHNGRAKPMNA